MPFLLLNDDGEVECLDENDQGNAKKYEHEHVAYDDDKDTYNDNNNGHEEKEHDIKAQNQQVVSTQGSSSLLMSSSFQDVQKPAAVTQGMIPTSETQSQPQTQKSLTTLPVHRPYPISSYPHGKDETSNQNFELKSSNHQVPETGTRRRKPEKVNLKDGCVESNKVGNGGSLSGSGDCQGNGTVVKRRLKRIRVGLSRKAKVDPLHPKLVERYRRSCEGSS
ncbi:unnamed protein product [Ambrosiozyma monospora]|uniref:Unnamed protein product n=1 Tax=Ambrosiozyma monospora TaxID=43982 RepID=A0ACB5TNB9_AMBMO|nr:unnamed protein product [Ambrosiozyma monospora]